MSPPSAAALRRTKRSARRALTPSEQHSHARAVARHIAVSKLLLCFQRFAVYAPSDGELDPSPIADRLLAANKVVALPVVEHDRRLSFYRYRSDTPLVRNRFAITEPDTRAATYVPTTTLDVVLMPLVAFDNEGYRLGMGGGFYDATFSRRRPTVDRPRTRIAAQQRRAAPALGRPARCRRYRARGERVYDTRPTFYDRVRYR